MGYIKTILKQILPIVVVASVAGCGKVGIISKETMSDIVAEMFLADQFVEHRPDMRGQTDSMAVYPAVIERNGHTVEEYRASIRYYLQRDDEYNRILKSAMVSLEEHAEVLDVELRRLERFRLGPTKWWALDSVRSMNPSELLYNPVMRSVRWMVIPQERVVKWEMGDSAVVDIPQNPEWWKNNINSPLSRKFSTYFFGDTEQQAETDDVVMASDSTTVVKDTVKVKKTPQEIQKERAEKLRNALMYGKVDNNIITEEVEEEEIELP